MPEVTPLQYFLYVWALLWKGLALWRAAKYQQRYWFIVLIILPSIVGVLEILYLFVFSKKRLTFSEIKEWFKKTFTTTTSK